MQTRRVYYSSGNGGPFSSIGAIIFLVLFFLGLFFLARGIFYILSWLSPVLLIATLIMDYKVVTNYLQWVLSLFRTNVVFAIGMVLLTIFGFPIVTGYLFGKAILKRKIKKVQAEYETRTQGQFVEYEEVDTQPYEPIELPKIKEPQKENPKNQYDQFFEEEK